MGFRDPGCYTKIFGGGGKILGTRLIRSGMMTMHSDPRPSHDADEAEVVRATVELATDSLPQFYKADVACPNVCRGISVHPGLPNLEPEILPNRSSLCGAALAGLCRLTSCLRALEHRISRGPDDVGKHLSCRLCGGGAPIRQPLHEDDLIQTKELTAHWLLHVPGARVSYDISHLSKDGQF
jgi:hypothetical protein